MLIKRMNRIVVHIKELFLKWVNGRKFCAKNIKFWKQTLHGKNNVYIAYTLHNMPEMLYEALLFSRGMLSAVSNYNVIALTSKGEMNFKALCKSFYTKYHILNKFSIKSYARALLETYKMQRKSSSGERLLSYTYRDILIGTSVYDTILVKTGRCTYEGEKDKKIFKIMFKSILLVDELIDVFSKKVPMVCIVMEEAYEAEIYRRVAAAYGGNIIWIGQLFKQYIDQNGNGTIFYDNAVKREIKEALDEIGGNKDYIINVNEQLMNYYQNGKVEGIKGRVLSGDAVKDKITRTKEEIINALNLTCNKKNVLVFAHCMSDGPHACPQLLYQDYYVWLRQTLKIACNNTKVNWIVKFHPDRFWRGGQEKADTDRIIEEFKEYDNIYFFPDNYSLLSAKNIADIIITARGKVGEEMSCFGTPVITAGRPCYSVWGYTYSFNTVEEYEECLKNIHKIDKLDDCKVDMAKRVFYAHSISAIEMTDDDIGQVIANSMKRRRKGNCSSRIIDISFYQQILCDDMLGQMRKSHIYNIGKQYAEKIRN